MLCADHYTAIIIREPARKYAACVVRYAEAYRRSGDGDIHNTIHNAAIDVDTIHTVYRSVVTEKSNYLFAIFMLPVRHILLIACSEPSIGQRLCS